MTAKHFNAIAQTIRDCMERAERDEPERYGQAVLARELADTFKQFNPRFDHARFLHAAGVEG